VKYKNKARESLVPDMKKPPSGKETRCYRMAVMGWMPDAGVDWGSPIFSCRCIVFVEFCINIPKLHIINVYALFE